MRRTSGVRKVSFRDRSRHRPGEVVEDGAVGPRVAVAAVDQMSQGLLHGLHGGDALRQLIGMFLRNAPYALAGAAAVLPQIPATRAVAAFLRATRCEYFPDGPAAQDARRHAQRSLPNGRPKKHKKSSCYYKNGKIEGIFSSWHKNGKLSCQGQFVNGLRNGEWTTYDKNKKKRTSGCYLNSVKYGLWTTWRCDGSLKYTETF